MKICSWHGLCDAFAVYIAFSFDLAIGYAYDRAFGFVVGVGFGFICVCALVFGFCFCLCHCLCFCLLLLNVFAHYFCPMLLLIINVYSNAIINCPRDAPGACLINNAS